MTKKTTTIRDEINFKNIKNPVPGIRISKNLNIRTIEEIIAISIARDIAETVLSFIKISFTLPNIDSK